MNRRDLLRFLVSGALAGPVPVGTQQPTLPVVGYLSARSPQDAGHLVDAFRRGLGEAGFVEGKNVTIEYRWALGQYDRLPKMAAELVRRPVTVLAATGGEPAALAAKAATSTIPIVFSIGSPISFGAPPAMQTGSSKAPSPVIYPCSARPDSNSSSPISRPPDHWRGDTSAATPASGSGYRMMERRPWLMGFLGLLAAPLVAEAQPVTKVFRIGLLSGLSPTSPEASHAWAGFFQGLRERLAISPIEQPTKFALVVNRRAWAALGLTIPASVLAIAEEILE